MEKGKTINNWKIIAFVLLIATIIDIFVPDPILFVDEILLMTGTILAFLKSERVI